MSDRPAPWKTRALSAIQSRMRSLNQPLYDEQLALREETTRLIGDVIGRVDRMENTLNALAASVLGSRWLAQPDAVFTRLEAGHWLNWLGLGGEGVEVGVYRGEFSDVILRTWSCTRLTSIDPWREFPSTDYVDSCNVPQAVHDANFALARTRLAPFADRSRIMRMTSAEAAPAFEDGSLDFVYLDAQHHYEAIRDDIALWRPKVRPGGVIAGHDYIDALLPSGRYGVKRAANEFAAAEGCRLIVTKEPGWPSWFARVG